MSSNTSGWSNRLLLVPALALLAGILLVPLAGTLVRSLPGAGPDPGWTLRHYGDLFTDGVTLTVLGRTALTAVVVTAATLLIGYPYAYLMVGSTFVFVTHDQEEAMSLSGRIALFDRGRIEQVGTPQRLYAEPETLFTARFLGDSNVFELGRPALGGEVTWEGERWAVDPATVAAHPGARANSAIVVRPEDVEAARDRDEVPAGANAVRAVVRDVEYLGSYRTLLLAMGQGGLPGRTRGARCAAATPSATRSWPGGGPGHSGSSRPERSRDPEPSAKAPVPHGPSAPRGPSACPADAPPCGARRPLCIAWRTRVADSVQK